MSEFDRAFYFLIFQGGKNEKNIYFTFSYLCTACGTENQKKIEIGITQIVEHPSLDDVRRGVIDALKEKGYDENKININYKNAQGDFGTAQIIAQEI